MILDGRWAETEEFLAPLSHSRGFDHAGVLFAVRRQRFLELLSGRLRGESGGGGGNTTMNPLDGSGIMNASNLYHTASGSGGGGGSGTPVMLVVQALRAVEEVCASRVAFNSLCYCLTLPSINDHPELSDWSPHLGRHRAFDTVRSELLKVFPSMDPGAASSPSVTRSPPGQLHRLLSQAAMAHVVNRVAADPRLLQVSGVPFLGPGASPSSIRVC